MRVAMIRRALALAILSVSWVGRVAAATADGSIITNMASVTFNLTSGTPVTITYAATATAIVTNPCVLAQKMANPTVASPGGTLTYKIWIVGCTAVVSAFDVVAIDRLPDNVAFAGVFSSWAGGPGTWTSSSSTDGITFSGGLPADGQTAPAYLRWNLNVLGIMRSAYVQYAARVL